MIGKFLRGATGEKANQIVLSSMPKPGPLLRLCEGVVIARIEHDIVR